MPSRTQLCAKALGTFLLLMFCLSSFAQTPNLRGFGNVGPRARITQAIDPDQVVPLKGNVHPLARSQYDRGVAPDSLPAERMLLVLQRSPEQQAALDQLLEEQQVEGSPNYHRWLTPQEFGQLFGPAESDINTITAWLTSNGFQVNNVAAGRNVIEFSGTAGQVRQAFGTRIHQYNVNGRQHWANANDPKIPAALAPVVVGVSTINSFGRKPMSHRIADAIPAKKTVPAYTTASGFYAVAPYDFATIYNVLPLWNSQSTPINGTGQSIAIVGRSNINTAEVASFRSRLGLPANPPNVILNGPDPGILDGESMEAYLDVEWSGAVAPQATINFVVTQGTTTTDGVDLSAQYIVDHNLSPVMSVSFGSCEAGMGPASRTFYNSLWEQAAAQGITVSVSSGDNGSAGCDDPTLNGKNNYIAASSGAAVSGLASTPFNVALGGTDFNQTAATAPTYWNTNNDTHGASAIGYIPETTWNESCAQSGTAGHPTANCSATTIKNDGIWAGSGGRSLFYAKPSWQSGSQVPADGKRDLPDVSLFSATGANKSFYLICDGSCADTSSPNYPSYSGVGGTSAAAPAFAGIMALVNQKSGARQGNANYSLYALAAKQTYSNCVSTANGGPASSCTFNDITLGNIDVPCVAGSTNCTNGTLVDPSATSTQAWGSKSSYDLATGLGSINVQNLVNNWSTATFTPTTTTITSLTAPATHGGSANVSITVAPTSGTGTPTGDVSLIAKYADGTSVGFDSVTLPTGSKTITASTTALPGGQYNVMAHYAGDGTFAASDSAGTPVTINPQNSQTVVKLVALSGSSASFATSVAYGSPYILRMWVTGPGETVSSPTQDSACASSNPATCPTGHITLKDGAALLDGGDFTLSGFGWVEDPIIQLTGGSHAIAASYQGDSSYNASTGTTNVTITKATTATAAPSDPGSVKTNSNVTISAVVTAANSNGAAPGAANGPNSTTQGVTFYDGTTALTGNVTYVGTDFVPLVGTGNGVAPTLTATITTQFTTVGTHQISAQYNGDINYSASPTKSASTPVTVTQGGGPATHMSVTAPSGATQGAAFNFTVTALDANNATANGYTGTVHFTSTDNTATLPTNATLTNGTGTFSAILNTIGTFTITATDTVTSSITGTSGNITVADPLADFTVTASPTSATVNRGSTGTSTITVTSTTGFNTAVALTCTVAPAVSKGPTCSFNPASVTPPANGTTTSTLTVATTPTTTAGLYKGFGWTLAGGSGVFAFVLLGVPGVRRRMNSTVLMLVIGLILVAGTVACGGGGGTTSGGGGSTVTGTPSGTYTVTVTGTGGGKTHTATFTVTVP